MVRLLPCVVGEPIDTATQSGDAPACVRTDCHQPTWEQPRGTSANNTIAHFEQGRNREAGPQCLLVTQGDAPGPGRLTIERRQCSAPRGLLFEGDPGVLHEPVERSH